MIIIRENQDIAKKTNVNDIINIEKNTEDYRDKPDNIYETGEVLAAVDIGTTTIAAVIYRIEIDSENKKVLKCIGKTEEKNEQTIMGADVMMRLMNCMNGQKEALHLMLVSQIEKMLKKCIDEKGLYNKLKLICIEGNTLMTHLLLDEDVSGLAGAPFKMAYKGGKKLKAGMVGFKEISDADIYVMPNVGSFVGADAVAVMSELKMDEDNGIVLAADIGTNAEIMLSCHGKIYATSVAAGPAFEGFGMLCGKRAQPGTLTGMRMSNANGNIVLDVIPGNGDKPTGICGAGYLKIINELKKHNIISEDGYICGCKLELNNLIFKDRMVNYKNQNAFILYSTKDCCGLNRKVYNDIGNNGAKEDITVELIQDDVRCFQMAKAAICAGALMLLEYANVKTEEVDKVFIAGMFGSSLDIDAVIDTGLLPVHEKNKYKVVGNVALEGCVHCLYSAKFRQKVEKLSEKAQRIELADDENFKKRYIESFKITPYRQ